MYFLHLIGISTAEHPIPVAPTVFQSGTIITRLPPPAYSALRSAFRGAMAQYPPADPADLLDTCYDLSSLKNVSVPAITLNYDGAKVPLEPTGVLTTVEEAQVCPAFAENEEPSDVVIIGNVQQRGMDYSYQLLQIEEKYF